MQTFDLTSLDLEQLDELIQAATEARAALILERKTKAMARARNILDEVGVSARELARAEEAGRPSLVLSQGTKYANPECPTETWVATKGRRPNWIADLERRGIQPLEVQ